MREILGYNSGRGNPGVLKQIELRVWGEQGALVAEQKKESSTERKLRGPAEVPFEYSVEHFAINARM